ncbi:MAG TPA: ATP-binding protein, partial [Abditibacterium sp.]
RSLGYSREELMAQPCSAFLHPDDLAKTKAEADKSVIGENSDFFENRYRCKDGTYKWLAWRARPVMEEQLVYAAARDITERKKADQVLEATLQKLELSNTELQNFASIASHDLQEPLRAIQAFGDRLQTRHSASLDEEGRDYLTRMHTAANRMSLLIHDLLSYSRVTTKARPFSLVNLGVVVQTVLPDMVVRMEETKGRVEMGDLPTIEADATQMRQLFQNLIANGLKFHRPDEPPVVKIYCEPSQPDTSQEEIQTIHLIVEDNGIGFEEKFAERIFAPFERLHNQRAYAGTGIGLAICRKIAQRHGGGISVQSTPGKGSRFEVVLPVRQAPVASENVL